ncbi:MAG: tyrosine-type recombinase/integrase [Nitriliruptorales bacterium]
MVESDSTILLEDGPTWEEARQLAGSFLAGFHSPETRRGYRTDLRCWFDFCRTHGLHPFREVRRMHLELYLHQLETGAPRPANATLYRRISTLSSWFRWLEDEEFNVGNPAARMRRPTRHPTPQPWLGRNQLTDLLVAAEDEGGDVYAMTCLLALNGLRVSEVCNSDVTDLGGSRYQPTLRILGKGDKPAEIVLNPRTWQAIDQVVDGRSEGPLLHNSWGNRMRRHNIAAILVRLAKTAGIRAHVTPHALRSSYITIGLQQGVPLREMQRAARHTKADTTIAYDQSVRSFDRDPTSVLMSATAR